IAPTPPTAPTPASESDSESAHRAQLLPAAERAPAPPAPSQPLPPRPPDARLAWRFAAERLPPRSFARWAGIAALAVALFAAGSLWTETGSGRDRRHHNPTPDAHEAYVKGRYFLDQRSIRGWQQALEQFERAVALDPNDPAAHAGLADAYSAMSDFGVASSAE